MIKKKNVWHVQMNQTIVIVQMYFSKLIGSCILNISCFNIFIFNFLRELLDMELFQPLVSQILANIIFAHIQTHVVSTCKDNYDNNYLEPLEQVSSYR